MNQITSICGLQSGLRQLGWTPKEIRIAWSMRRERFSDDVEMERALFDLNEWLCAYLGRCAPHAAVNYLREGGAA